MGLELLSKLMAVLLAATVVAGCSTQQPATAGDGPPDLRPLEAAAESEGVATSVASDDERLLYLAEERLVAQCMRAAGHPYEEVPYVEENEDEMPDLTYGTDDPAFAERFGYLTVRVPDSAVNHVVTESANQRYVDGLNDADAEAWSVALTGSEEARVEVTLPNGRIIFMYEDGCVAQIKDELYGDLLAYLEVDATIQDAEESVYLDVVSDDRFATAQEAWADCMREQGHSFQDPQSARDHVWAAADAGDHDWEEEQRIAVADATCAAEVGLLVVARQLEEEHLAARLAELEHVVLAERELRADAVGRASELVGGR